MPTPLFKPKGIAFILVALLLVAIGLWVQNKDNTPDSLANSSFSVPKPTDGVADSSTVDGASDTNGLAPLPKKPLAAPTQPARPGQTPPKQAAKSSTPSTKKSSPAESTRKPAQVACEQLVMRNGDLVEAKVIEIGINEIRYKKCRWKDGPDYVIPKADVLSIRYADGEIERFTIR